MKVSLLFFGIPTIGMLIVFYLVLPWLEKLNLIPFERLVLIITVPMALLFASAIIIYKFENRNGSLGGFLDCFRLRKNSTCRCLMGSRFIWFYGDFIWIIFLFRYNACECKLDPCSRGSTLIFGSTRIESIRDSGAAFYSKSWGIIFHYAVF